MFILKPELFQLAGFDENCLWLLTRCFASRANNGTKQSFPSYNTIASDCGWSRRKAIMVVQQLVELGLITKETRSNKDEHTSNLYTLNTDMVLSTISLKAEAADPEVEGGGANFALGGAKTAPVTTSSIELYKKKINKRKSPDPQSSEFFHYTFGGSPSLKDLKRYKQRTLTISKSDFDTSEQLTEYIRKARSIMAEDGGTIYCQDFTIAGQTEIRVERKTEPIPQLI